MPWRIEAGGNEYIIDTGESVVVSAPSVTGDEKINCRADVRLDDPYLAVSEVVDDKIDTKEGEIYVYPLMNRYQKILSQRGVKITFI